MADNILARDTFTDIVTYEDEIPIRGCSLSLPQIRTVYRELERLVKADGERLLAMLTRQEGESQEAFAQRIEHLRKDAFKVTTSIVGGPDEQTAYGETDEIFSSKNLPTPIKTIYFINTTAYRRNASNTDPGNRFSVWLDFGKPALFEPHAVSEPTPNNSRATVAGRDVGFFRAVQNIVRGGLSSKRQWYAFIHRRMIYDAGLWFVAAPYSIYIIWMNIERYLPLGSRYESLRVPAYIYGLAISLILYRALTGYLKWAYPVNVLDENSDRATKHRIFLATIIFGFLASGIKSIVELVGGSLVP